MGRRAFLGALLGGAVLDPERLLWVPGKKLISIPVYRAYPFRVRPSSPEHAATGAVLERVINHRWATDAAFREEYGLLLIEGASLFLAAPLAEFSRRYP